MPHPDFTSQTTGLILLIFKWMTFASPYITYCGVRLLHLGCGALGTFFHSITWPVPQVVNSKPCYLIVSLVTERGAGQEELLSQHNHLAARFGRFFSMSFLWHPALWRLLQFLLSVHAGCAVSDLAWAHFLGTAWPHFCLIVHR